MMKAERKTGVGGWMRGKNILGKMGSVACA